jgi:hypothetical protein
MHEQEPDLGIAQDTVLAPAKAKVLAESEKRNKTKLAEMDADLERAEDEILPLLQEVTT